MCGELVTLGVTNSRHPIPLGTDTPHTHIHRDQCLDSTYEPIYTNNDSTVQTDSSTNDIDTKSANKEQGTIVCNPVPGYA